MIHETLLYIGIAFIGAAGLIVVSKFILQSIIRVRPDFYEAIEATEEAELLANVPAEKHEEHAVSQEPEEEAEPVSVDIESETTETEIEETIIEVVEEIFESSEPEAPEVTTGDPEEDLISYVIEEPVVEEPVAQEPVAEEPIINEPVVEVPQKLDVESKRAAAKERAEAKRKAAIERREAAKKSGIVEKRSPKPSMKMKKKELIAIAEAKGIEVPAKATKIQILDLIEAADNI